MVSIASRPAAEQAPAFSPGTAVETVDSLVAGSVPFLIAASLASAVLLALGIDRQSLWLDEVMSLSVTEGSSDALWAFFRQLPEQHPVYYLVLRGWVRLVGSSDAALRALSAVFAVATLWALYPLARRIANPRVARIACVLMAASPFALYYGQEARMYAMLGFLATLGTLIFVLCLEDPRWERIAALVAIGTVGAYTHLYYLFLMASLGGHVVYVNRRSLGNVRRVIGALIVVAASYLPWAALILIQEPSTQFWKGPANVVLGVPYTFLRFVVGYSEVLANYQWKARAVSLILENLGVLLTAGLSCGVLLLAGIREARRNGPRASLAITALLGPMVLAVGVSIFVMVIGERYFIVSLPFFVILVGTGIDALHRATDWRRRVGAVATAAYAAVVGLSLLHYYRNPEFGKEQWAEVGSTIRALGTPDDIVLLHSGYIERAVRRYYVPPQGQRIVKSGDVNSETLLRGPRIWLVLAHAPDADAFLARLKAARGAQREWLFRHQSGIRLVLLNARDDIRP